MLRILICTITALFLASCSSGNKEDKWDKCNIVAHTYIHNDDTVLVADVSKVSQNIIFPLSELVSDWKLLKLGNKTKQMMVSPNSHIFPSENYLVILDKGDIFVFNHEGRFLRQISRRGSGPADIEYGVIEIRIDEKERIIYVTDCSMKKIKMYHLDNGSFLGWIPLPYDCMPSYIVNSQDSTIVVADVPMNDTPILLWKQDFHGNVLQSIPSNRFENPKGFWMIGEDVLYIWKNKKDITLSVLGLSYRSDSLFHYNEKTNELHPCFAINFSGEVPDHWLYETSDYYMVTINGNNSEDITPGYHNGPKQRIIIDRKTGRGAYAHVVLDGYGNIPITKQRFYMWSDYFTLGLSPEWVAEMAEKALAHPEYLKPEEKERLQALLDGMTEEDNSFVLYGKIK